jgi:hypothetical protein
VEQKILELSRTERGAGEEGPKVFWVEAMVNDSKETCRQITMCEKQQSFQQEMVSVASERHVGGEAGVIYPWSESGQEVTLRF